jgi:predicted ABC-type ATPase
LNNHKQLWILAGGNGAGKSTFYRTRLASSGLPFVNADILAKQLFPLSPESHSYDAAVVAAEMRAKLLQEGRSFCFETVFSHPSKIDFVAQAKTMGYEIILVFIHLDLVSLNQARVAQRVSEGGHSVPDEKVISRIPRVLKLIKTALPLCNQVHILNNSRADDPFQQIATLRDGCLDIRQNPLPEWATEILADYLSEI